MTRKYGEGGQEGYKVKMKKRSVCRLFNCFDENRISISSHDIICRVMFRLIHYDL